MSDDSITKSGSGNGSAMDPKTEAVLARYRSYLQDEVDPREWAYAWRTEINRGGFRAVDFLMDQIVDSGRCIGCASCLTICPRRCIRLCRREAGERPARSLCVLRAVCGGLPRAAAD